MSGSAQRSETVASMLWRAAEAHAGKPAVVERERSWTYDDVRARAGAIARRLSAGGVKAGDRVVVQLERGADAVASYFGVIASGAVVVVANELLRPRQVEYMIAHAGARALLSSVTLLARMPRAPRTDAELILLDDVQQRDTWVPVSHTADEPAQITYTSGSTGLPKGVVAGHGNVWAAIETVADYLGIREDDRIAGMLPISGVYGANQMLCSVLRGGTLIVPKSPVMNQVASELRAGGATVLAAVPPLWMQLLSAPGFASEPIATLRVLQNAGGHLAPSGVARLRAAQPQAAIYLQYGMTEVFRSTYLPPEELDRRPGCMGRAMPGAEILVMAEDGRLCDVGEVGELVHAGPTVAHGYWNDAVRTAEVFRAHPLTPGARAVYSGDMVRRDEDGYFFFVGRKDRMIKTLGYRVGPDEILDVLYASGQISEGIVTSVEDDTRGQRIVAFVVLTPGGSLQELKSYSGIELPRYMQPNEFVAMAELPKLPNGKHDLTALREGMAS